MTPQPRKRGGQTAKASTDKPVDEQTDARVEPATAELPEPADGDADSTAKDGEQPAGQAEQPTGAGADQTRQPAAVGEDGKADILLVDGDPVPAEAPRSMVRGETGLSPEVPAQDGAVPTAPFGDTERNGKATGIPTDTTGQLRHVDGAVPTAAYGQDDRNGHATGMAAEGQIDTGFGGNGDSVAKLVGSGVRGEQGVGTADPDIGDDERPQYPSTTLTRESPDAAPMEPEDVKLATEPKLGDVNGSTDPLMAAAAMPSMPGDQTEKLVDSSGDEVLPSDFFEVPDGIQGRTLMRVNRRVSRVFTIRKVSTPNRQLLFTEGQLVPVEVAETLIRLHG